MAYLDVYANANVHGCACMLDGDAMGHEERSALGFVGKGHLGLLRRLSRRAVDEARVLWMEMSTNAGSQRRTSQILRN